MQTTEKPPESRRPHSFKVTPSLLKQIQNQARKEQRNIAVIIERAIDLYCSKDPKHPHLDDS